MDGLPPGSSVPGILQARTLEWVYPLERVFTEYLSNGAMVKAAVLSETVSAYTILYVLLTAPVVSCPHCPCWARCRHGASSEAASKPEARRPCRHVSSPPAADPVPTARTRRARCLPGGARVCRAHGDAQGLRASASGPRARGRKWSQPSHLRTRARARGRGERADPASRLTYSSATTVKQCLTCVNDWAIDSQNNQTNFSLTTDSNQFFPPCMFLRRTCDWYFFRK